MDNKIAPVFLDAPRAWRTYTGGALLDILHGKAEGSDSHYPEEWIMSVVSAHNPAGVGKEGEGLSRERYSRRTLRDIIEADPERMLGKSHYELCGSSTGVLAKLIDSSERLTIQVHPDRARAKELFNSPYGKTECWYILGGRNVDGEPPCIYFGFKNGITRQYWQELFEKQDIPAMLDAMERFEVKPGDTVLIEGGIPHAIGAGCFLMEIQEPTDLTLRTERKTPGGLKVDDYLCHQGIGFDRMFECFHYDGFSREELTDRWFIRPECLRNEAGGSESCLVGYDSTPYFRLNELVCTGELDIGYSDSFYGLYVLSGSGLLEAAGETYHLDSPCQLFMPAGMSGCRLKNTGSEPVRVLQIFGPQV